MSDMYKLELKIKQFIEYLKVIAEHDSSRYHDGFINALECVLMYINTLYEGKDIL